MIFVTPGHRISNARPLRNRHYVNLGRAMARLLMEPACSRPSPRGDCLFALAWIFTSINKLRIWARSVGLRHTAGSLLWAPWIIV